MANMTPKMTLFKQQKVLKCVYVVRAVNTHSTVQVVFRDQDITVTTAGWSITQQPR